MYGRSGELSELRGMDDRQVGQIAHEFGLSRSELFTLCANKASGALLKQRLAEFGPDRAIARQAASGSLAGSAAGLRHLHDDRACAHDFAEHRDSGP